MKNRGENEEGKRRVFLHLIFATLPREPVVQRQNAATIERFHSRGQHLCKCIGTKESVYIRKEFNSYRTGLGHQYGHRENVHVKTPKRVFSHDVMSISAILCGVP